MWGIFCFQVWKKKTVTHHKKNLKKTDRANREVHMVNQACKASQLCQQREEASLKSVSHDSDLSQFNRLHSWRQPHQQHNRALKYLLGFPTFAKETQPLPWCSVALMQTADSVGFGFT